MGEPTLDRPNVPVGTRVAVGCWPAEDNSGDQWYIAWADRGMDSWLPEEETLIRALSPSTVAAMCRALRSPSAAVVVRGAMVYANLLINTAS